MKGPDSPPPPYRPPLPETPASVPGAVFVPEPHNHTQPEPDSPPPPYRPPLSDSPPPPYRPPLPERSASVQEALFVPETHNHTQVDGTRQQAAHADRGVGDGITWRAARPDRFDEESPAQGAPVQRNESATSPGQHRAERGERRMKIRAWSWAMQLGVWILFLGMIIASGRARAVEKQNEEVSFRNRKDDSGVQISSILFTVFFFVSLIGYCFMCADAGTRQFVANLDRELNVQHYVQQLRTTVPVVRFRATCYHMETRTRTVPVTSTDSSGRTTTTYRTETYQEMVVTHSATEEYPFTLWEDATATLSGADSVKLTKLHLSKELGFLTDAGEQLMLAAYNAFCAAHHFDVFQSYSKELHIEGFKERILCLRNVDEAPWWLGGGMYWIASFLLANVPYRVLLDWNTGIIRHTITKKIA